jgi:hypothetical protein
MFIRALRRSLPSRFRPILVWAVMPLTLFNGMPISAGCICADGHYEPVCRAGRCRAGMSDCGCSCCAKTASCKGKCCCRKSENQRHENMPGQRVANNGCCKPVVVQVPTVVTTQASTGLDVQPIAALVLAPIDLPFLGSWSAVVHRIDFDTGPPPNDLIVTLQRLVI